MHTLAWTVFDVAWVPQFWNDLSDLCKVALNNCYEKKELTRLCHYEATKEGGKCRLEATNYRPISLLSVFYKMATASGVITRRLENVM